MEHIRRGERSGYGSLGGREIGGKTNTTTTNQSTAPPADVLKQYQALIQRAQGVSQGPTTAGPTALQNQAWSQFGAIPGQYEGQALDAAGRASAPIDQSQIQRYENPYQSDVINATTANLNENDALQQSQVRGNAIAQGALGGNRLGVAQAELARNQNLARGQTIAGLNSANYSQALGAAGADRDAAARGAGLYGSLEANAANVAGGQLQAGEAQRGINQSILTQPYQQAGWLAGLEGAIGPQEGTTTSGSTSTPGPSALQTIAGLGVTAAGIASGNPAAYANIGSNIGSLFGGKARGGSVPAYAEGGGVGKPSSRVHEMMQTAIDLANTMKAGISGGAFGGAVDPGIGLRGYDDGGGVFPDWMFDPSQASGGVELLERGTGKVLDGGGIGSTLAPPPQTKLITDRIPLSPPTLASVSPQTGTTRGISAPPPMGDTGDGGPVDVTGLGDPVQGAPPGYTGMVAGKKWDPNLPQVDVIGQGGPGGIADPKSVPYDTSGTSPKVLAGIAAQKASAQGAPEWSLPLIAAGLGILASRSPNLGVALGEGGLQGVNQLMAQRKQTFDQTKDQRDYDLQAKRLEAEISQHAQEFGLQKEQADFTTSKPFPIGMDEFGRTQYGVKGPDGTIQTVAGGLPGTGNSTPVDPTAAANKYNLILDHDQADRFSQVPDQLKPTVAGVLSGTQVISDIPGGARSPYRINVLNAAKTVDPNFDEVATKAGQTFETSKSTQQFMANARTASATVDRLVELSNKIDRGNVTVLNNGMLALKSGLSDPTTKQFLTEYNLLGDELGKILGSGQGSDFAIKLGQSLIDPTGSKESVAAQGAELKGRIVNKLGEYKAGFRQANLGAGPSASKTAPPAADALADAKAAIAKGAPRDAVIQRLRQNGIDPGGL